MEFFKNLSIYYRLLQFFMESHNDSRNKIQNHKIVSFFKKKGGGGAVFDSTSFQSPFLTVPKLLIFVPLLVFVIPLSTLLIFYDVICISAG